VQRFSNSEEANGMRHNHLKIRIWLALAVAIASLGLASSASARLYTGDVGSTTAAAPPPATVTSDGFEWGDALVGAGVALGAAFGAIGIAYAARSRTRQLA
jgi:hypothetical protein